MNSRELTERLRARFDAEEALRDGLETELAHEPAAEAYCRQLEALQADIEDVPIHLPDPGLTRAVTARLRHTPQRHQTRPYQIAALAVAAVGLAVVAGSWLRLDVSLPDREELIAGLRRSMLSEPAAPLLRSGREAASLASLPYAQPVTAWFREFTRATNFRDTAHWFDVLLGRLTGHAVTGILATTLAFVGFNAILFKLFSDSNRGHTT